VGAREYEYDRDLGRGSTDIHIHIYIYCLFVLESDSTWSWTKLYKVVVCLISPFILDFAFTLNSFENNMARGSISSCTWFA